MTVEPIKNKRKIVVGDRVVGPTGVKGTVYEVREEEGPGGVDVVCVEFDNGLDQCRSERTIKLIEKDIVKRVVDKMTS